MYICCVVVSALCTCLYAKNLDRSKETGGLKCVRSSQKKDCESSVKGLEELQSIMDRDWSASIQQQDLEGEIQEGQIQSSSKHKCVRIEMNGCVYLYTQSGLHTKSENGEWTYMPVPDDLAELWTNPKGLVSNKKAEISKLKDGSHVVYVNSDGRFIQLFWNNGAIQSWIVGSVQSRQLINEVIVTLDRWNNSPKTRSNSDWKPQSGFLPD